MIVNNNKPIVRSFNFFSYLLDVPVDGERQVEEELEPVQHRQRVARRVSFVLAVENVVEELVRSVVRL